METPCQYDRAKVQMFRQKSRYAEVVAQITPAFTDMPLTWPGRRAWVADLACRRQDQEKLAAPECDHRRVAISAGRALTLLLLETDQRTGGQGCHGSRWRIGSCCALETAHFMLFVGRAGVDGPGSEVLLRLHFYAP